MDQLTPRQIDILKATIKEYSDSGDAVGSEILEKKYKLGVSPATIRNEMVELAKKGYLKKSHFSSGRIPSAKGFRFYIKHLMQEREVSTVDEVAYKNGVWDDREEVQRLLSHGTKILAQRTGLMSLVVTEAGDIYYAGVSHLLDTGEFMNVAVPRNLFELLDETDFWEGILRQIFRMEEQVMCMLGEEDFRDPSFEACASVFGEFSGPKTKGIIGVVGPKRMYYDVIIPQVRYFSRLLETMISEQEKKI